MMRSDDFLLKKSPVFSLNATQEDKVDLTLTQSTPATGRVRGNVTNSATGAPVNNATVKLSTNNGVPVAHTLTNPAGNYIFENLAPGSYVLNVALDGFQIPAGQSFALGGGQTLVINVSITPITDRNNVIYGRILNQANGAPIIGAEIVLQTIPFTASGVMVVTSNASGQYEFCQLQDGSYNIAATEPQFYTSSLLPVSVSGGVLLKSDISLQPVSVPLATVNGFIRQTNGTPIPNACVGLYSIDGTGLETLLQITYTDLNGFYIFGRAAAGNYVVKAKSEKVV